MSLPVAGLVSGLEPVSADGVPLDLALRIASIITKGFAGIGTVAVDGTGRPICALLRSIEPLDAARESGAFSIRLTIHRTIEGALLAVIALLAGIASAILTDFLLAEDGTPVAELGSTRPKAELCADSGIARAILSGITVTL